MAKLPPMGSCPQCGGPTAIWVSLRLGLVHHRCVMCFHEYASPTKRARVTQALQEQHGE